MIAPWFTPWVAAVPSAPDARLRKRFPRIVLEALRALHDKRDGVTLRRLSLTLTDDELATVGSRDAALLFVDGIANESRATPGNLDRTGALLVLDISPSPELRPHWFGFALTTRDNFELDLQWAQLVGRGPQRSALKKRVRYVTGQGGDWFDPSDELRANVRRAANYAAKSLPRGAPRIALAARVIASGAFVAPFVDACTPPEGRHCKRCGESLDGKRRQAVFCSDTCQKLAHKASGKPARKGQP